MLFEYGKSRVHGVILLIRSWCILIQIRDAVDTCPGNLPKSGHSTISYVLQAATSFISPCLLEVKPFREHSVQVFMALPQDNLSGF